MKNICIWNTKCQPCLIVAVMGDLAEWPTVDVAQRLDQGPLFAQDLRLEALRGHA